MSENAAWGFVGIPRDQAAQLSNLTAPIPGWDDHYLVGIDVFHQLHCLVGPKNNGCGCVLIVSFINCSRTTSAKHCGRSDMTVLKVKRA
jgi:hypothetical protein